MIYALIVTTITTYGATHSQRVAQFSNFHDCVSFAVAWTDAGLQSRDSTAQWQCQKDNQ
jgi:hypothetical protein